MQKIPKLIIILLIVASMSGCAKNPEDEVIINKNEDKLEQAIEEYADIDIGNGINYREDNFEVSTGDLEVIVDAEVKQISQKLPVIRVIPHEITTEDLKQWGRVVFAEEIAYDPGAPKSKSEIEEEIIRWKHLLNDTASIEEKAGYDEEAIVLIKEDYEATIAQLEKAYQSAPDTAQKLKTDYEFHIYEYYADEGDVIDSNDRVTKNMEFEAVTDWKDGMRWKLSATNRNEDDFDMHQITFFNSFENIDMHLPYNRCSSDEAHVLAKEVMKQLGLTDWEIYYCTDEDDGSVCKHTFTCTQTYNGIPTLAGVDIDLHSDDLYAANLYYGWVYIEIENGVVTCVECYSPMDVVEVENENVKTLAFDEIYECFKSQMQSQYSKNTYLENGWFDDDAYYANAEVKIHITDIQQGLFRIKIKDNSEEYRMVPAWIFKGYSTASGGLVMEEDMGYVVINAIDGSVINPNLGY